MSKASASKEASTEVGLAVAEIQKDLVVPDHLASAKGGNDNVDTDDLTIPRLVVLQDLSPEVKKTNAKHIEGAEAGMIMNTLTKELYSSVRLVNCYYNKEYLVFKKRLKGGGFFGAYKTVEDAKAFIETQDKVPAQDLEAIETANHFCLVMDDNNNVTQRVVFPMTSTKLGVSRSWNSMIINKHADLRPACIWQISTIPQSNTKGDFYNLTIGPNQPEWVSPEVLEEALKFSEIASQMETSSITNE
ncbi:MAG: hypothetical protein GTN99_02915 [Candidatus Dadabacteria bacterium]|nr:hypothetical protein [Candidatus Dadabacteria bacterium]